MRHAICVTALMLAACAGPAVRDGPREARPGVPILQVTGHVPAGLEATLWVEYAATVDAPRCRRLDGESGRVRLKRLHRHVVRVQGGRHATDIVLDPRDEDGCGFVPATLYLTALDRDTQARTDAFVGVAGFARDDSGVASPPPRRVTCQVRGSGAGGLGCSLPRELDARGHWCSRFPSRSIACTGNGCRLALDIVRAEPGIDDALWSVPRACRAP